MLHRLLIYALAHPWVQLLIISAVSAALTWAALEIAWRLGTRWGKRQAKREIAA